MWKPKSVKTNHRNFQLRKEPHTPILVCKESAMTYIATVSLVFIELMHIIPCFPQTRICCLNNNYSERVKGYIRGMQV